MTKRQRNATLDCMGTNDDQPEKQNITPMKKCKCEDVHNRVSDYAKVPENDYQSELNEALNEILDDGNTRPPLQRTNSKLNESLTCAWTRVCGKYDPMKKAEESPIKQIDAVLEPSMKDDYMDGFTWILSMSEQFYYDNSLQLVAAYINEPKGIDKVLRANFNPYDLNSILEHWSDITVLGRGTFGEVIRVKDDRTNEYVAIKRLFEKGKDGNLNTNTRMLLDYLKERYYLIQSKRSPFIVQFYYSFQLKAINGYFLVFEWCIKDLRKLLDILKSLKKIKVSEMLYKPKSNYNLPEIYKKISSIYCFDIQNILIMYAYEMLCAVDFLGQCNIIHRDLKPANIMISQKYHLKIADFGLVNNTNFICRKGQAYFFNTEQLDRPDKREMQANICGTRHYYDLESLFFDLLINVDKRDLAYAIMDDPKAYRIRLPQEPEEAEATFLTDLWATGKIILEILFLGRDILNIDTISDDVAVELGLLKNEFSYNVMKLTFNRHNYKNYVVDGVLSAGGNDMTSLMDFVLKLIRPRQTRGITFVKSKDFRKLNKIKKAMVLDMKKVNSIETFKTAGLNEHNVFLNKIPSAFKSLINEDTIKIDYETGQDWYDEIAKLPIMQKMWHMKPGTELYM